MDVWIDAPFEVAVATQHRARDEVLLENRVADLVGKRPAVADAGRAPVADGVETESLKRGVEACLLQVVGDDP